MPPSTPSWVLSARRQRLRSRRLTGRRAWSYSEKRQSCIDRSQNRAHHTFAFSLCSPDRNPGRADAQKRFERLGVINKILRDERRDRYDHFLTNGFPRWRGTGYFYERFRPGLGSVIAFILMLSALVQRLVQGLNYRRDSARLENLRRSAQLLAWGPTFEVPGSASTQQDRKVRVPLQGLEGLPSKPDAKASEAQWTEHEKTLRKVVSTQASAGWAGSRLVDVFVSNSGTFVLDPASGDRLSLDADSVPKPSVLNTWPFALVKKAFGSGKASSPANAGEDTTEGELEGDAAKSTAVAGNGNAKKNKKKRK